MAQPLVRGQPDEAVMVKRYIERLAKQRAMMYVYTRSESNLWTVGFFRPNGKWEAESDHSSPAEAADRCHWLNGGERAPRVIDGLRRAHGPTEQERIAMCGPDPVRNEELGIS